MKTGFSLQLVVNVRHQVSEAATQAELYAGIYAVSRSRQEVALFVPAFERTEGKRPPVLPDDLVLCDPSFSDVDWKAVARGTK